MKLRRFKLYHLSLASLTEIEAQPTSRGEDWDGFSTPPSSSSPCNSQSPCPRPLSPTSFAGSNAGIKNLYYRSVQALEEGRLDNLDMMRLSFVT